MGEAMKVSFWSNLDAVLPFLPSLTDMPVPRVGERVLMRKHAHSLSAIFELEVVGVVYDMSVTTPSVRVELHLPKHWSSIHAWEEWFKRK
jgi:hypothetical protein